ncbi:PLP-dependent aminotransferase family protein [Salidesulfovibrio onnuriiensis]|uniref:aminotransferase-like domain-containing protein n=1 Tax=Salidesulfovibrio onnuriiensis TaxID=2583823 RepID=UPI0011CBD168|nr:PLP-dependent aminotransferase family protein [Salidesulfovibrio onnuriiensis]
MGVLEQDNFRYQTVEKHLLGMIDSGALNMGDKLPSLRGMSRDLGVSISTVNQAYVELEGKGIIESRPRSGFFVRRSAPRMPTPDTVCETTDEARPVTRSGLIRTVLEAVGDKEMVPLNVFEPTADLLPVKEMSRVMSQVMREHPEDALEYDIIPGNAELRRQIAMLHMETGCPVRPDDMIITIGCFEALYIALRATTRAGDTVLIQAPTYYCFLHLLENLGLRVVEIPSHIDRGVDPADLASALRRFDIKACIFSPNYNNPDSSCTPDSAKREIVNMLGGLDIPIIEDDVSTTLHFGPKRPTTMKQYDEKGLVLLCSSFSKTLCPGYRVGWILPGRFMERAMEVKYTTNVCTPTPTQRAVAEYLRQGRYPRQLKKLRRTIESQMDTMLRHIGDSFPRGTRVTHPQGGGVLWLELPGNVDSVDLFFAARENGINIAPGSIFSTQDKFGSHIRLSCTSLWNDSIKNALETVGGLARSLQK